MSMKAHLLLQDSFIDPDFVYPYQFKPRLEVDCSEGDCCKQSHASECDINVLMSRYETTGVLEHRIDAPPQYGDFSDVPDYAIALQIVIDGQKSFASMEAIVRDRFGNDPARFMDFVENPSNIDEGVRLGIFKAPPVPEVAPAPIVPPVPV